MDPKYQQQLAWLGLTLDEAIEGAKTVGVSVENDVGFARRVPTSKHHRPPPNGREDTPPLAHIETVVLDIKTRTRVTKAQALINTVRVALNAGLKHYSKDGKPLLTPTDVLSCLRHEKLVYVERPDGTRERMGPDA